jgi:hypothetical protein
VQAGTTYNNHFLLWFGQLVIIWAAIDVLPFLSG